MTAQTPVIRVAVVEDEPQVREGFRLLHRSLGALRLCRRVRFRGGSPGAPPFAGGGHCADGHSVAGHVGHRLHPRIEISSARAPDHDAHRFRGSRSHLSIAGRGCVRLPAQTDSTRQTARSHCGAASRRSANVHPDCPTGGRSLQAAGTERACHGRFVATREKSSFVWAMAIFTRRSRASSGLASKPSAPTSTIPTRSCMCGPAPKPS